MPTSDELADALYEDRDGGPATRSQLRALARAAAKQALLDARTIVTTVCQDNLDDYYGQVREEVNAALTARAEQIGEGK